MNKSKTIDGIPKTEKIWEIYKTLKGERYFITSKINNRDYYYLYKMNGDKAEKIGRAKSPKELKENL